MFVGVELTLGLFVWTLFCKLFREQQIMSKWQQLIDLLEKKKKLLMGFNELLGMFREIESIGIEMSEMEVSCFLVAPPLNSGAT